MLLIYFNKEISYSTNFQGAFYYKSKEESIIFF